MNELVFVKLGGSVITDKAQPATARPACIRRLANEVAGSLEARPQLRLVLGHGSGSFGHVMARRYGTQAGVRSRRDWRGFAHVAAAASRLNRIVTDLFLEEGVPVWSLQPSTTARCENGQLVSLDTESVEQALLHGLVPLIYGDVALDSELGGTIVSTEQIFGVLAKTLRPGRVILTSAVDGVFESDPLRDATARPVATISGENWDAVRARLTASQTFGSSLPGAADVTGAMLSKVDAMVSLARSLPGLRVQILSGLSAGVLRAALQHPSQPVGGTIICWGSEQTPESCGGT